MGTSRKPKTLNFGVTINTEHGPESPLPTPSAIIRGDYQVIDLEIYEDGVLKRIINLNPAREA